MLQAKSKRSFNRHTEMTQLFPWVWTIRWLWCGFWQTWAPKKVAKWLLFATTAVSLEMGDTYVGGEREKKKRERESWGKVQLTSHATIILRHIFLTVWHSYLFVYIFDHLIISSTLFWPAYGVHSNKNHSNPRFSNCIECAWRAAWQHIIHIGVGQSFRPRSCCREL